MDIIKSLPIKTQKKIAHNDKLFAQLQEKYSALIKKHSQDVINEKNCPRVSSEDYQIYFCWLQGEENLPPIVRCCYNSLKQNAGHYKIVFIDEQNFSNYVDITPHIMEKFRAGKISRTHFSDILRVNLLERYGGLWLDATILVTDSLENHKDFLEMPFCTRKLTHEKDYNVPNVIFCVAYSRWSTYIQGTSILHNPLYVFEKEFFDEYLRDFDGFTDYLIQDFAMALAFENIPCVHDEMVAVPINNIELRFIGKHINDSYAQFPFDKILKDNFFHKQSWKKELDMTTPGTVFREIQKRYAPETLKIEEQSKTTSIEGNSLYHAEKFL